MLEEGKDDLSLAYDWAQFLLMEAINLSSEGEKNKFGDSVHFLSARGKRLFTLPCKVCNTDLFLFWQSLKGGIVVQKADIVGF